MESSPPEVPSNLYFSGTDKKVLKLSEKNKRGSHTEVFNFFLVVLLQQDLYMTKLYPESNL